jgi:hypothetical protein
VYAQWTTSDDLLLSRVFEGTLAANRQGNYRSALTALWPDRGP